jgi:small subunit ribosomal protein S2
MSNEINIIDALLDAGVHIGHKLTKSHPKMIDNYSKGIRNNKVLIDLKQTILSINTTSRYLSELRKRDGKVLFVCQNTKYEPLLACFDQKEENQYYIKQWPPGLLTNWYSVLEHRKTIDYSVKNLFKTHPKKAELKRNRFNSFYSGLKQLDEKPDLVFVLPARGNEVAIHEANACKIPVAGIMNTDFNPSLIDYPIFGNDLSPKSMTLLIKLLTERVKMQNI